MGTFRAAACVVNENKVIAAQSTKRMHAGDVPTAADFLLLQDTDWNHKYTF